MNQVANCLRHKRYGTEREARASAVRMRQRHGHRNIRAYPCKCGGELHFHIGNARRR
jgi:hypothetical protein